MAGSDFAVGRLNTEAVDGVDYDSCTTSMKTILGIGIQLLYNININLDV